MMVTGTFAFFVPEADGLNVLIAGFRSELILFEMIAVGFSIRLMFPREKCRNPGCRKVVWRGISATTRVVFANTPTQPRQTPVSNNSTD